VSLGEIRIQTHTEGQPCKDREKIPPTNEEERPWKKPTLQHLDLGPLASRTERVDVCSSPYSVAVLAN
jgi:hypothetical protein